MATMLDVLRALNGSRGMLSQEVAEAVWPGRQWHGSANGGPSGGQRAAAGLCGRLQRRGLVRGETRGDDDPRTYWRLTHEGAAALSDGEL